MSRKKEQKSKATIDFHFVKSNYFRVIHADGVWGGLTVRGDIHSAFYSERPAIPKTVTHAVENGIPGEIVEKETRGGIVREVEVEVLMDLTTAISYRNWLNERIHDLIKRLDTQAGGELPLELRKELEKG